LEEVVYERTAVTGPAATCNKLLRLIRDLGAPASFEGIKQLVRQASGDGPVKGLDQAPALPPGIRLETERVQISLKMSPSSITADEFTDGKLFSLMISVNTAGRDRHNTRLVLGQQQEMAANRIMGDIRRVSAFHLRQGFEITSPLPRYFVRVN
jgi:hypothetical protein